MTATPTLQEMADAIDLPLDRWRGNCHSVSLRIVKQGLFGPSRVARGVCKGVSSQHSWVVCSRDDLACYDRKVRIVDPTLHCHRDDTDGLWEGSLEDGLHAPHGYANIWEMGCPVPGGQPAIRLELPPQAQMFIELMERVTGRPMDHGGRNRLFNGALAGVPVMPEIVKAAYGHDELRGWIPIDIVGMLTDVNPGGLYLGD